MNAQSVTRRAIARGLLATTAMTAVVATLPGCSVFTSNTVNGVTTITVNVATATTYFSGASALVAALSSALLMLPGLPAGVGAAMAVVSAASSDIAAAIPALTAAAGGNPTYSFNTNSVPAFITSVEADAKNLMTQAQAVVPAFGAAVPDSVGKYVDGIVSVATAIAGLFTVLTAGTAAAAAPPKMPVGDALAVVHVKAP